MDAISSTPASPALGADDDPGDCAFCMGRAAAHRGADEAANPFPPVDLSANRDARYDTDYGMWLTGFGIGLAEGD